MATIAPGGGQAAFAAVAPGSSAPIGPTVTADGVNFSVFSQRAAGMELLLFDATADDAPSRVLPLGRATNRTGGYWHGFVPGSGPARSTGFGPAGRGPRPRGCGSTTGSSCSTRTDAASPFRPVTPGTVAIGSGCDRSFDEERGRRPVDVRLGGRPRTQSAASRHGRLRGACTRLHRASELGRDRRRRGTYAGFIERIPYLVDLGVSAVELLPVFQFDRLAAPGGRPNYWGYQPVSYFAPHAPYSSRPRCARRCRRVPRSRQGAPPRRARGHPRRRLQPHGRERRRRADASASGDSPTRSTTCSTTAAAMPTTAGPATVSTPTPRWCAG